ncbi:M28 family peptidase [Marinigracilibium pacificum]|uniref:Carboxypeptidase Q n=1 Tax=Marinigracilibium pacificum TaxID=2729599 RepID=A0A848J153_9BACT|nr:M28 family peptidase [Marinigracilibium pacificum]NMM50523.1 M28 family peptidase [Marinigracilibium pacificum]
MRKHLALIFLCLFTLSSQAQDDKEFVDSIFKISLTKGRAYEDLRFLTKNIGGRLSGSPEAAAAVEYTRQQMLAYGFDSVWLQPVMVPHWVRGNKPEIATVISQRFGSTSLPVTALGNTVGTGSPGVTAGIIELNSLEELTNLKEKDVEGKIVFFNRPFDETLYNTFGAYGKAVDQRGSGPAEAAKKGALAVIVRSMGNKINKVVHTGMTRYQPNVPKIPAVAISTYHSEQLSEMLKAEPDLKVYIETHCAFMPDKLSYNVIGQINGTEFPDDYIVVGGHLDSWDLGEGAHDDGAGCVQSIDALRVLKLSGYKPRYSIRAVMFMNEENGLRGGQKYAELAGKYNENHLAAIESDRGGFSPRGFTSTGTPEQKEMIKGWMPLLLEWGYYDFDKPGGGADISPLSEQNTLLIGLLPDSQRYFYIHHTPADVFESVNQRELELGVGGLASMLYLLDKNLEKKNKK